MTKTIYTLLSEGQCLVCDQFVGNFMNWDEAVEKIKSICNPDGHTFGFQYESKENCDDTYYIFTTLELAEDTKHELRKNGSFPNVGCLAFLIKRTRVNIAKTSIEKAKVISDMINGGCWSPLQIATWFSYKEHRYLQQELFKMMYYYIELCSKAYEDHRYDPRNEWACQMANIMVNKGLKNSEDAFLHSYWEFKEAYEKIQYE